MKQTAKRKKQNAVTRLLLLKSGGKKALRDYNNLSRVVSGMRTGTIVHQDKSARKKHRANLLDPINW